MKVLFWNTHNNAEIDSYIYELQEERSCDIIILAEYCNNINGLCNQLSLLHKDFYPWETRSCNLLNIISVKNYRATLLQDDHRYSIYNLKSMQDHFILTALHLPSKLHCEPADMEFHARRIRHDIEYGEKKLGHRKSLVIGDFNINPFESACINADCFHALPDRAEAQKGYRTVSGFTFSTFYNPMWNLFGDFDTVSGSYFYDKNKLCTYQWNIHDQVILRPELINQFVNNQLTIIHKIKSRSLLDQKGRPDHKISDHLPLYFEIKEVS